MVFINDDWELDTKTGVISIKTISGKKVIAEVFGATDLNPDNEKAMTYAKLIKAAPKMYGALQGLTFLWKNLINILHEAKDMNNLINFAEKIINDVEGEDIILPE